jgi:hypothetical protein
VGVGGGGGGGGEREISNFCSEINYGIVLN